jgi:hypothetical protein
VDKDLTWRDIFDYKTNWPNKQQASSAAEFAGYKFFVWNNRVYDVVSWRDTGLIASDLK